MNGTGNRWGLPEGYEAVTRRQPVEPTANSNANNVNTVNTVAVDIASKSTQLLEKVLNDMRVENEKLKRENTTLHSQVLNYNVKINTLEDALRASNDRVDTYRSASNTLANAYASGGYAGSTPTVHERVTQAPSVPPSISQAINIAATYEAPVNPMTVFVEFLEELNVFQEYVDITLVDDISFNLLCTQYEPSDWISRVCVGDDGEYLEGWDEADDLWLGICEMDDLDSKEAYVE